MSTLEIPLLRESTVFAERLAQAAARRSEPRYHFHRRVNWSHRYGGDYYNREVACFRADPQAYIAGTAGPAPMLEDVFAERLRTRTLIVMLLKVLAHWLFCAAGRLSSLRHRGPALPTYRKCYVDDIELVFDPFESGVLRAVYPFPLGMRRQWRYLVRLRREGHRFMLAGTPYLPSDVLRLLWRRDIQSLMRLESRAQILHAGRVIAAGIERIQLSDEFDIGSLDFTRRLRRSPLKVVNSAHGVGKYLPVHAYGEFHVLTHKQESYYRAVRPCTYALRALNIQAASRPSPGVSPPPSDRIQLVWLSQKFPAAGSVIADHEATLMAQLRRDLGDTPQVQLLYKAHPNSADTTTPQGFARLDELSRVNGREGTVFASFFSTCQIDPSFVGTKVLVRGAWIFPEMAFDDSETVLDGEGLVALVRQLAAGPGSAAIDTQPNGPAPMLAVE